MKTKGRPIFPFQEKVRTLSISVQSWPSLVGHFLSSLRSVHVLSYKTVVSSGLPGFVSLIKTVGINESMDEFERRKLGIFNLLNFFGVISGIIFPLVCIFDQQKLPAHAWVSTMFPPLISLTVLLLNNRQKYGVALVTYFILYPIATSMIYLGGINMGIELFFILYGILSVFFLQDISYMIFSASFSMVSYFMLSVAWKKYTYDFEAINYPFFLFNQAIAILFIFYGLFLVKQENHGYQRNLLQKSDDLLKKHRKIKKQKKIIAEKAKLLTKQTEELIELNAVKNKLFSVISHDLKSPMYALRNLFRNMQQHNMPAEDIKEMIPEIVNDLNYTTTLMENLLQWAKTQMTADAIDRRKVDITKITEEVINVVKRQAEAKKIYIENKINRPLYVVADADMINTVLRNLVSNAIKFTPENGNISVGSSCNSNVVEIFVSDSGTGMSDETLEKIQNNEFYTTRGTSNETGTGLGLMLCKEFVAKNMGTMKVTTKLGEGSVFSFTLPISA